MALSDREDLAGGGNALQMTCRILTFPSKAKPRPVLYVPASNPVIALWAQMEARKIAFAKNSCEHNRIMFNDASRRYVEACERENHPA